jgi:hypothetical protein
MLKEIGCEFRQPIETAFGPAILDRDVLAIDEAEISKALAKRDKEIAISANSAAIEESDHRHAGLLGARSGRPREHRAAKHSNKFPPCEADCHRTVHRGSRALIITNDSTPQSAGLARRSGGRNAAIQSLLGVKRTWRDHS